MDCRLRRLNHKQGSLLRDKEDGDSHNMRGRCPSEARAVTAVQLPSRGPKAVWLTGLKMDPALGPYFQAQGSVPNSF